MSELSQMENILLKLGADGGCITIISKEINGVIFYELKSWEVFGFYARPKTFLSLVECWHFVKCQYPNWHQLYLVQISTQMIELIKRDYILTSDKNEYTIDSWLVQLTGRGIGF